MQKSLFLRQDMVYWYMKPLKPNDCGTMWKEIANKDDIIKTLAKYVFAFLNGKYKLTYIHKYGLLVCQDV